MEMIFRNIPLARSGHSDKRGDLNAGTLCMIAAHSFSKIAMVHYKNIVIGVVRNLTFNDLHNGMAELRGDIVFDRNYNLIAKMALDEVYPSISVSATYNDKAIAIPCLNSLSLVRREEREFEDQPPLDLSDLLNLVNNIAESEAPESAVLFNKKYDNTNSGLIGYVSGNKENKILLNKTDTLEAKDGYLIVDAGKTKEAIRIDTINRMYSVKNNDNSKYICIYGRNGGMDISHSTRLSIEDLIKFIERYKESQFIKLKSS
ncbi:hypothetical protein RIX35_004826 [Salmonella enterica]|nr:hypothetical protein [Salmonella enterica]